MAIAYVQGNVHQNGATSSTTVAVTLTNPIGAGNMVCVSIGWAGVQAFTGVTDDKGNTYTVADVQSVAGNYSWATAYCLNITNGARTITATISSTTGFASILVDEFSGVAASAAIDGHQIQAQVSLAPGTDAVASALIGATFPLASVNGDLVYGSTVNTNGAGNESAGTGFTQAQHIPGAFLTEYQVQSTAGYIRATATPTANSSWLTTSMAFRAPPVATNYVQGNYHQNGATSSSTVAVTLTNPIGGGNMVCVGVGFAGTSGNTVTGISDDKGNTYTLVDFLNNSTQGYNVQSAYRLGIANGARTITASFSTAVSFATIAVDEFLSSVNLADGHSINTQNSLTAGIGAVTSNAITTTASGDLVYGLTVNVAGAGSETVGSGFSPGQHVSGVFLSEYQTQSSAGSIAGIFTPNSISSWTSFVMAFKGSGPPTAALAVTEARDTAHFNVTMTNRLALAVTEARDIAAFNATGKTIAALAVTEARDTAHFVITNALPGLPYYVSPTGSDSNDGLSPATAWQTIGHVNAHTFSKGDSILFQGGHSFAGALSLSPSSFSGSPPTSSFPLTIGSYGSGNATLTPASADAILLTNIGNTVVQNLILTGDGSPNHNGVNITVDGSVGVVSGITVSNLAISGFGRCGVLMAAANTVNILANVIVQNCTVSNCTTNITISSNLTAGILAGVIGSIGTVGSVGGTFGTTLAINNLLVTGCTVQNCPGYASTPSQYQSSSGVLLTNIQNSTIDRCYIANNGANEIWGNSGIEFNWATNCVVQFCEVYNQISANAPADGDGIDIDVGCHNCMAQYNYVHHCGGAGLFAVNFPPFTHDGVVFRYNICENNMQSQNYPEIWIDSFSGGSAPTNIKVYNNTVFNNIHSVSNITLLQTNADTGNVTGYIANNLIYQGNVNTGLGIAFLNAPALVVDGNVYYSANHGYIWNWQGTQNTTFAAYKTLSGQDAHSQADTNPLLNNPGNGGIVGGYFPPAPTAYQPLAGSPVLNAGLNLLAQYGFSVGTHDYYNVTIPGGTGQYSIGGSQAAFSASGTVSVRLATTEARDVAMFNASGSTTVHVAVTEARDIAAFTMATGAGPTAINFPDSPTIGQSFTAVKRTWTWDGVKWVALSGGPDALSDGRIYGRQNSAWTPVPSGGVSDAPSDSNIYGRQNATWVVVSSSGGGGTGYLALSGGTMSGPLTLVSDPTAPLQAATKQYVDAANIDCGTF